MIRFTRSRTSCAATSTFFSSTNATSTWEMLSLLVERSWSMPLTVFTASSILSVISVSISWGVAPSRRVVMATVGKSTLGKRSTGSRVYPSTPTTTNTSTMTLANTGRLTEIAASHCMS